jgi:hypothetical protein
MEEACHGLDLHVAQQQGLLDDEGGASFSRYTVALQKLYQLKEESQKQAQVVSVLDELGTYLALTLPEGNPALDNLRRETTTQRSKLQTIVRAINN